MACAPGLGTVDEGGYTRDLASPTWPQVAEMTGARLEQLLALIDKALAPPGEEGEDQGASSTSSTDST